MDSENKENSTDKNYGFPFVEVIPVRPHGMELPNESLETTAKSGIEDAKSIEIEGTEEATSGLTTFTEKKKKSQTPLLLSLVLFMVVILMVMSYFFYFIPNQAVLETPLITDNIAPEEEPMILLEQDEELLEEELLEEEVMEEEIVELESEISQATEILEAPAKESKPLNIILVTEKGPSPNYYIIAGSLPNEQLAREEVKKLFARGATTVWLISPTGDTKNYRISIGKYRYFQSATEALNKARMDFDESLWVLKY